MSAASTASAIFAAQDGFAPSQMVPERMASALTIVWLMMYKSPPQR